MHFKIEYTPFVLRALSLINRMFLTVFRALNNILSVSFFNILAGAKTIVAGYGAIPRIKEDCVVVWWV